MNWANGMSVTWNPVAKIIVSTSCRTPSAPTTPSGRTSVTALGTTSTLGWVIAGYHSLEGRIRLHPST